MAYEVKSPTITVLSDHPTKATADSPDHLAMESRLAVALDILRHINTKCPITIAVYGDWGTGKTSAMHWLETQLKEWNKKSSAEREGHPCVYPVWFDPWKYHTREEVWRGIIAEIIIELFKVESLDRQNFIPRMKEAAKKFGAFLGKGFLQALANMELKIKAGDKSISGGEAELSLSGEMFRDIYEEYDKAAHPEKAYLNEFESTLEKWVQSFINPKTERIVLFIDDLDRCLPQVVLEVLEAIKLYLSIEPLMFVVGLDRSVVDSVVTKHYVDNGLVSKAEYEEGRIPEKCRQYLNKIFQVEIQIPPSEKQMEEFLNIQIEALNKTTNGYWTNKLDANHKPILESGIRRLASHNPREIIRLLNSALLRGRSAVDNPKLVAAQPNQKLLFAQGIQFFLVQRIINNKFSNAKKLLLEKESLEWFERFSKFLCNNPHFFPPTRKQDEEIIPKSRREISLRELMGGTHHQEQPFANPLNEKTVEITTAEKEYHLIIIDRPNDDAGKPLDYYLLEDVVLWDLLRITFSAEVAQSAPRQDKPLSTIKETVKKDGDQTDKIPSSILDRIAHQLNKSVDSITKDDLINLEALNLFGSDISDSDLSTIVILPALQSLDLHRTNISDAGLEQLSKNIQSLQSLNLRGTNISDAGLEHLVKLQVLQSLDLGHTKISDAGLEQLVKIPSLQSLNLCEIKISDAGLEHLTKLPALQSLYLTGTNISDAGLEQLAKLPSLQTLDLGITNISDVGLEHLAKFPALQNLLLIGTKISDAGIRCLAKLNSLQSLDLQITNITDVGLEYLSNNQSIKRLALCNKEITDEGLKHLSNLTSLETLEILFTKITDSGLENLVRLTSLKSLTLSSLNISDAGLERLAKCPSIQKLNLIGTKFSDAGLLHIAKLPSLRELYLSQTMISDAGLEHLSKIKSLEILDLLDTNVTDVGLEYLYRLPLLKELNLKGTKVTAEGKNRLYAISSLKDLNIYQKATIIRVSRSGAIIND